MNNSATLPSCPRSRDRVPFASSSAFLPFAFTVKVGTDPAYYIGSNSDCATMKIAERAR